MVLHANVEQFESKSSRGLKDLYEKKLKKSDDSASAFERDFERFVSSTFNKTMATITDREMESVDYEIINKHLNRLGEEGLANSSINRHMYSIFSGLRYLRARQIIKTDLSFLDLFEKLNPETEEIEYMPEEVVEEYLKAVLEEKNHAKLKLALIIFSTDTGLRLKECLNFKKGQFKVDGNEVFIIGYGKGGKQYRDKIAYWIYEHVMSVSSAVEHNDLVFGPLNRKNITDMMARLKKKLGYTDRKYSFHSFKKTAVTFAYRLTGGDITEAQRKGRHESTNTTRRYIQDIDYGMTGMFSNRDNDPLAYQKVDHETLLEAINHMGRDFRHLLNLQLSNLQNKKGINLSK